MKRLTLLLFCHAAVVGGCFLTAWGAMSPLASPVPSQVFSHPLFWGLCCLLFGVCGIRHLVCRCTVCFYKGKNPPPKQD